MNKPIRTLAVFCLLLFSALMVNVTYLQYWRADSLDDDARNRRAIDATFSRERGAILVGREPVAESVPSDDRYQFQRRYNQPRLYAHLTGWYNYFNAQSSSCQTCQQRIEQTQNEVLSGSDDRLFVTRLVDLLTNDDTKGGNVKLTIDPEAQQAAYDGLSSALGPGGRGAVVALDPRTGAILASVSLPTFNPNDLADHDLDKVTKAADDLEDDPGQPLLDRTIQTTLPPGSTFKIVTAAAAIENGFYRAEDQVPGGATYQLPLTQGVTGQIDNEGRSCGENGGTIPFTQAMGNSCNTTFAQLAVKVGADAMLEQAERFGFNQTYFEDLLPQAESVFPEDMDAAQTGQSGFGQFEVRATPLQVAMVSAAIANDGRLMKPYLVEEVQSPEFAQIDPTEPEVLREDAVSPETADELTDLLVYTVADGTASPAAIEGVDVAGKTGTAQSGVEGKPPYAWFTSFAPADDPQVAVAVMIEKTDRFTGEEIAGGLIGGPIAKAIMEAVIDQ